MVGGSCVSVNVNLVGFDLLQQQEGIRILVAPFRFLERQDKESQQQYKGTRGRQGPAIR
jgi:hypothetical protein